MVEAGDEVSVRSCKEGERLGVAQAVGGEGPAADLVLADGAAEEAVGALEGDEGQGGLAVGVATGVGEGDRAARRLAGADDVGAERQLELRRGALRGAGGEHARWPAGCSGERRGALDQGDELGEASGHHGTLACTW